jgi:hypothetical protein
MLKAALSLLASCASIVGFVIYFNKSDCFGERLDADEAETSDTLQRALIFTGVLAIFFSFFSGFFVGHGIAMYDIAGQ